MRSPHFHIISFLALSTLIAAPLAQASDIKTTINQWYTALEQADDKTLSTLLADNAEIVLKDVGITQDRQTFLKSMTDWADAIEGGALRHKIISQNDAQATIEVCYDFAENDILMREIFTFDGAQIIRQDQEQLDNAC